jgi:hypothetical protein
MHTIILVLSVLWVLWYMLNVRSRARRGAIVFPPLVSANLLFLVSIVLVLLLRISALHLIWLFPVCLVVGFILLAFPIVQKVVFAIVMILAYPIEQ